MTDRMIPRSKSIRLCFFIFFLSLFHICFAFSHLKSPLRGGPLKALMSSDLIYDPVTVSQKVFEQDKRPVILFDGVCNLCNNAVNLALDWDPNAKLRFSALQSNVGRSLLQANGREANDISSIVVVTEKGAFIKSDAILVISEELTPVPFLPLKPLAKIGRFVVPQFLRDIIYDGVADNRYNLMGKRNECRFDADGEFENRFVNDDIAMKK